MACKPCRAPAGAGRCRGTFAGRALALAATLISAPLAADHPPPGLTPEQSAYREGLRALDAGDYPAFNRRLSALQDHLLYPFLAYRFIAKQGAAAPDTVAPQFRLRYGEAFVSERLHRDWLRRLVSEHRWALFLAESGDVTETELRCHRLRLILEAEGASASLTPALTGVWLSGDSRPSACDAVFAAWHRSGGLTRDLVWQRVELALARGNTGLARHLGDTYLDAADRTWIQRWVALHTAPATALAAIDYPVATQRARAMVRHGVIRLAGDDPERAAAAWSALRARFAFDVEDNDDVLRSIGLNGALARLPQAPRWLEQVSPAGADATVRTWRVRAALAGGDWPAVANAVNGLDGELRDEAKWRYWRARALEQQGATAEARALYGELAETRNYYGFLAADRLQTDYAMRDQPFTAGADALDGASSQTGLAMALELRAAGDLDSARQQWAWATRDMSEDALRLATLVAHRVHWHDQAIITAARARYWDDLDVRFPLLYRDLITGAAAHNRLPAAWVFGVIRQESAFATDARSHVGALGLMQLMPATARRVAASLDLELRDAESIMDVPSNIRLGTAYLREVLERSAGNPVITTASYNAGPHRVDRWLPQGATMDADIWIEIIPFRETRNFVKNVLGFTVVYEQRLGTTPRRLRERMPPIVPRAAERVQ